VTVGGDFVTGGFERGDRCDNGTSKEIPKAIAYEAVDIEPALPEDVYCF
jgi:hypothetical protein